MTMLALNISKSMSLPHFFFFKPESMLPTGEGIDYPLQYSWAFLVAQLVKNPPAMRETWV